MGALDGIRVVDLSTMISGPMSTRILGDQGADVIKVEPPEIGDLVRHMGATQNGVSATFATANRNKRSVLADLKTPDGQEFVRRLVGTADIFVQNFRPGAIERLQLGYTEVRKLKPDIIYTSISGFGTRGPFKDQRVYDPVIQALSGLAAIQADRETGRPRMMRLVVPDKLTAVTAAQAMTAALFARERTGKGQLLELSMLDATIAFHWSEGMAGHTWKGERVQRRHSRLAQDLSSRRPTASLRPAPSPMPSGKAYVAPSSERIGSKMSVSPHPAAGSRTRESASPCLPRSCSIDRISSGWCASAPRTCRARLFSTAKPF